MDPGLFITFLTNKTRCLVLFLFLGGTSYAGLNPDSLKKVARTQKDSIQVDSYINLARYYFNTNHIPDSMIKFAQLAASSAKKYNLIPKVLKATRVLGLAYVEAKKIDLAKKTFDDDLRMAKEAKNTKEIIEINNLLGYLYGKENDFEKSAFYYLNSAKEFEKLEDYRSLGLAYVNVVVIFTLQDQYEKMLFYTNKALDLIPKLNPKDDADMFISIYSNAALHYFLVGENKDKKDLIEKSLIFADSCLAVGLRYDLKEGLADAYYILGYGSQKKKDYRTSINYFNKVLNYKDLIPERTVFNTYSALGRLYLETKNYKLSTMYLDSCKSLPVSKENDAPSILASFEYDLFKKLGDSGKALLALENLNTLKQSFQDKELNKVINDLEVKYQSELKEAKIAKLNQQREIDNLQIRSLIGTIAAIVLLLLAIVFFYRQSIIKNKLKTIETEQRLNRARMNPHFFFNALSSLQNMALSDTKKELVPSFISKFSKIMRQSLESTYTELDTVENEIAFLTDYLELQKLRSENRFTYTFKVEDALESHDLLMPGMILQPFIENSIEHGFKNISHEGCIEISVAKKDKLLLIEIKDNGKGLKDDEKHKGYPSRATQIIKDRLFLLNKTYRTSATFVLTNLDQDKGTLVQISLPVIYKT